MKAAEIYAGDTETHRAGNAKIVVKSRVNGIPATVVVKNTDTGDAKEPIHITRDEIDYTEFRQTLERQVHEVNQIHA